MRNVIQTVPIALSLSIILCSPVEESLTPLVLEQKKGGEIEPSEIEMFHFGYK